MCGIFGIITPPKSEIPHASLAATLKKIGRLSESRGKDSSGIAFRMVSDRSIRVIKGDLPIRQLLKSITFHQELEKSLQTSQEGNGFCAFGHARLVTNGSQLQEENNQPVIKDGVVIIHNGIIVNTDDLWAKNPDLKHEYLIDTEIIASLIRKGMHLKDDLSGACSFAFEQLVGSFSIAAMFEDLDQFVLSTNNGSLYYLTDEKSYIVFASEANFLQQIEKDKVCRDFMTGAEIVQLSANQGLAISLTSLSLKCFNLKGNQKAIPKEPAACPYKVDKQQLENDTDKKEVVIDPSVFIDRSREQHLFRLLEFNADAIRKLRRCTRCLLPETFPFIEFDHSGICNYCHNYAPKHHSGSIDELQELVAPYRTSNGKPDCIVPFSGGRDSTYSLYIIKKELGLHPIAFTYDWGMVTDLARRNIARVCGKLGVENIIVSADIRWKRENIRKNVQSWLKNPALGMIPLFMAGDKFFFYYTNQIKKQTGINLNIWGINHLENTEFKIGFAGLPPKFDKKRIYSLSMINQLKLFGYVAKNVAKSPGYLNQSVIDSLGSFASRYIAPKKDYYHLFDYYRWDEDEINELIKNEYKWETAIDTKSTWRIGDGTASFYNYIYYTVAGFSENDTFRSNQIREGMLTRERALQLVEEDNIPRYETLRWYLEIIGVDFATAIKRINQIPKLYEI